MTLRFSIVTDFNRRAMLVETFASMGRLRNVYQPTHAEAAGFIYRGIGRGEFSPTGVLRRSDRRQLPQSGARLTEEAETAVVRQR